MSKYGVLKKNKDSCLVPQFLWAATQARPLDHLALVANAVCIPGSHQTATIRETVLGRLTPPEQCMDNKIDALPPVFCGDLFSCPGLWPKGQASGLCKSRGYRDACKECRLGLPSLCSLYLAPAHWYLPETNLCISLSL